MATKSTTTKSAKARVAAAKKGGTTKSASRKATRKTETVAKSESTRMSAEARAERDAQNTERMLEMREEGSSWSTIAEELGTTPGKAMFLMMLHRVSEGDPKPYPKTRLKDDESIAALINEERDAAGEFSSWGWISARSGISEPKLKALHEEHNSWKPKTENIAINRAAKHGDTDKAKAKSKTNGSAAKGKTTAASAAKAKARARSKAKTADPS